MRRWLLVLAVPAALAALAVGMIARVPFSGSPALASGTGGTISIGTTSLVGGKIAVPINTTAGDPFIGANVHIRWDRKTLSYFDRDLTGSILGPDFCAYQLDNDGLGAGVGCISTSLTPGGGLLFTILLNPLVPECTGLHIVTVAEAGGDDLNSSYTIDSAGAMQVNTYGPDLTVDPATGEAGCTLPTATATPTITLTPTPSVTPTPTATETPSVTPTPDAALPTAVALLNPGICLALTGGWPPIGCALSNGLEYQNTIGVGDMNLLQAADRLGDGDGVIEPEDFASAASASGGQIHQDDGGDPATLSELAVIAFVNNDLPVTFQTSAGLLAESWSSTYVCAAPFSPANVNTDSDCGAGPLGLPVNTHMNEDHVVVAYLRCTVATWCTLGPQTLTVTQGLTTMNVPFTVVGEPQTLEVTASADVIDAAAPLASGKTVCPPPDPLDPQPLAAPGAALITARARDAAGTLVAGAWVAFSSSDAALASPATLPVAAAPAVYIGADTVAASSVCAPLTLPAGGPVTIHVALARTAAGQHVDPHAGTAAQDIPLEVRYVDSDGDGYGDAAEVGLGKDPNAYCAAMRADVTGDYVVNILDLAYVAGWFGQAIPPGHPRYDQNADNKINLLDLARQAAVYASNVSSCP